MSHTDAGPPVQIIGEACAIPKLIEFTAPTRQVSIRNTGTEAMWFSFDGVHWFDIACGTSWDDRVKVDKMWVRTQTGWTTFVSTGIRFNSLPLGGS